MPEHDKVDGGAETASRPRGGAGPRRPRWPARRSASRPVRDELCARLAERGHDQIRPCHRALLGYVDDAGARLTELAHALDQPKQYVGRLIDELEVLGYVERRPDPTDRRSKLVVPTDRGRDEQLQADRILAEIEARHAARIGADNHSAFRRLLRALAHPDEIG